MSDDANHIRALAQQRQNEAVVSLEQQRDSLQAQLDAALEDNAYLRSLLHTIVDEVSETYGGHEAIATAQRLLRGEGKTDGT